MPTALIIGAVVAVLVVLLATASYKVCPANKVMVITGRAEDASSQVEARSSSRSSCAWTG